MNTATNCFSIGNKIKTLAVYFLIFFSAITVSAQSVDELDKKNGFRDIKFGISLEQLKTLGDTEPARTGSLGSNKSDMSVSLKLRSDITLNDRPIDKIRCKLVNDKLYQITLVCGILVEKGQNYTGYIDYLVSAFGKPKTDANHLKEWDGSKITMVVNEDYHDMYPSITIPNGMVFYQIIITISENEIGKEVYAKSTSDGF